MNESYYISVGILILAIIAILILLASEYVAHDCIPGKNCTHSVPHPKKGDSISVYFDKINAMIRNNYEYVKWRQSLLVGLIVTTPIVYFLKGRIPTLSEWIVITLLVTIATYFSFSWLWSHFIYPNSIEVEKKINILKNELTSLK